MYSSPPLFLPPSSFPCPSCLLSRCSQNVLGIEAARCMIASEIKYIMTAYGITVDRRHLMLLSDVMTFKGDIPPFLSNTHPHCHLFVHTYIHTYISYVVRHRHFDHMIIIHNTQTSECTFVTLLLISLLTLFCSLIVFVVRGDFGYHPIRCSKNAWKRVDVGIVWKDHGPSVRRSSTLKVGDWFRMCGMCKLWCILLPY